MTAEDAAAIMGRRDNAKGPSCREAFCCAVAYPSLGGDATALVLLLLLSISITSLSKDGD